MAGLVEAGKAAPHGKGAGAAAAYQWRGARTPDRDFNAAEMMVELVRQQRGVVLERAAARGKGAQRVGEV